MKGYNGVFMADLKKLIVLPGNLTSSFFINEIPYFQAAFHEAVVITYGKNRKKEKEIATKFHLNCKFCSLKDINFSHIYKWLKWLGKPYVREEIRNYTSFSKIGIRRFMYICFYGLYQVLTEEIITQEIENNSLQIYLYAFWLSRPAFCIADLRNKYPDRVAKIYARAHGYDLYEERNNAHYLPFRSHITKMLDVIYFISAAGKKYYKNKIVKMGLVKDVCELKISRLGTSNVDALEKKIIEKKHIIIVSCSAVIYEKRLDLIAEVIAYLQKQDIDVRWLHIGNGKLMPMIKKQSAEILKKDSYYFLGYVDNSKILQVYMEYDADYFINLSDSEGIPVSIMEAMSVGLPVIARDVGGNNEIVNSNVGCLLEKNMDTLEMSSIICDFVKERIMSIKKYKQISDNSKAQWNNLYFAEKNYKDFYHDLLKE